MVVATAFWPLVILLALATGSPGICLRIPGGHGLDPIKFGQQRRQRGHQGPQVDGQFQGEGAELVEAWQVLCRPAAQGWR
jgi:hypothetical protein